MPWRPICHICLKRRRRSGWSLTVIYFHGCPSILWKSLKSWRRRRQYCKRDRTASKRKCWSDRRSEFCVKRDFGHPATIRTQDTPPSLYSGHMIRCMIYFLGAYGCLQDAPVGALPVHAHTQNSNVLGRGCLPFPYLACL